MNHVMLNIACSDLRSMLHEAFHCGTMAPSQAAPVGKQVSTDKMSQRLAEIQSETINKMMANLVGVHLT